MFPKICKELQFGLPRKRKGYPGYNIRYQILTASDYGVPQYRKRLFIVGVRKDLNLNFEFLSVITEKRISVGEAIGDLIPLTPPYISLKSKSSGFK